MEQASQRVKDLKREKDLEVAKEKGRPGRPGSQETSERLARERAEREAYIAKMKEQVNVISSNVYGMAL